MFAFQLAVEAPKKQDAASHPNKKQPAKQPAPDGIGQGLMQCKDFTPRMREWLAAAEQAAKGLRTTVCEWSKVLAPDSIYLGPNPLDTSFFYRITPGQVSYDLKDYIDEEHLSAKHGVPFVQRDIDFLKNPANFSKATKQTLQQRRDLLNGLKKQPVARSVVGEQEFGLLGRLIYDGRQDGVDGKGTLLCLKHFPGSDNVSVGITHVQESVSAMSLQDLYAGPLAPFIGIMRHSEAKPPMVMVNFVSYPKADSELRGKYPGIQSIIPEDASVPAVFSPHLVRGLLRRELGFEGLVVTDAIGMGAITKFLEKKPGMPADFSELRLGTKMLVLSVYSGINKVYGFGENSDIISNRETVDFYNSNKEFRLLLDALAFETLFLEVKSMPEKIRHEGLPDLSGVSLADSKRPRSEISGEKRAKLEVLDALLGGDEAIFKKLDVLVSNPYGYRPSRFRLNRGRDAAPSDIFPKNETDPRLETVVGFYAEFDDLWNRGGLLDIEFRRSILDHLHKSAGGNTGGFSDGWKADMTHNLIDWHTEFKPERSAGKSLDRLFSDAEFKKLYDGMDWNGIEWQSVFAECLRRFNTGDSGLQNGGRGAGQDSTWFIRK